VPQHQGFLQSHRYRHEDWVAVTSHERTSGSHEAFQPDLEETLPQRNLQLTQPRLRFIVKGTGASDREGDMEQEMVELTVRLPDDLAREAQASGLLTPQALGTLLQEELRRRRIDRLFQAADRLAGLSVPLLTEAELEAEIQAVRRAKRSPNACGR
jgi:post-segregation antitoxin (ccd killing protein)